MVVFFGCAGCFSLGNMAVGVVVGVVVRAAVAVAVEVVAVVAVVAGGGTTTDVGAIVASFCNVCLGTFKARGEEALDTFNCLEDVGPFGVAPYWASRLAIILH